MTRYWLLLLTLGWWTRPSAAQELAWLFSLPSKDPGGRHNARDLTKADGHATQQLYDPYRDLRLCTSERVCGRKQFCDLHYGVCRDRAEEGQPCRHDHMCQRSLDCSFGACQQQVERGREGARCRKDRDCDAGLCCARRHGQRVCQRHIPLGHKCFVPDGGPDYAINERCPCQSGLICKYTSHEPPPTDPAISFWSAYENMRCVPPSHNPHSKP